MSGTVDDEPVSASPSTGDHRYFQAIEAAFVELRGAPLLLSPADWRVAQSWYRQGVPLDLVVRTLDEVFAKRRERGAKSFISSLRYCARAVEAAWAEARELGAAGTIRRADDGLDLGARLSALAAALPEELPDRERWLAEIGALAGQGDSEATESALTEIDARLVASLLAGLDEPGREALAAEAEATLGRLGRSLPADERERARERLVRERLRRKLGLPVLSLFAPEAVG